VARQPIYQALVRDTQDRLLDAGLGDAELRYAEIRALVGGVTAIQGASGRIRSTEEAWSAMLTCASSASTGRGR
jgi:5-methylthioadenosine/S-adenosylhomocysteine deaminase